MLRYPIGECSMSTHPPVDLFPGAVIACSTRTINTLSNYAVKDIDIIYGVAHYEKNITMSAIVNYGDYWRIVEKCKYE